MKKIAALLSVILLFSINAAKCEEPNVAPQVLKVNQNEEPHLSPTSTFEIRETILPKQVVAKTDAKEAHILRIYRQIGMNDEQIIKAREINLRERNELTELFKEIKTRRDKIAAFENNTSMAAQKSTRITELEQEIEVLKNDIKDLKKTRQEQFSSLLTSAQIAAYNEIKKGQQVEVQRVPKNFSKKSLEPEKQISEKVQKSK